MSSPSRADSSRRFGQLRQQPTLAGQLQAGGPGLINQTVQQLRIDRISRSGRRSRGFIEPCDVRRLCYLVCHRCHFQDQVTPFNLQSRLAGQRASGPGAPTARLSGRVRTSESVRLGTVWCPRTTRCIQRSGRRMGGQQRAGDLVGPQAGIASAQRTQLQPTCSLSTSKIVGVFSACRRRHSHDRPTDLPGLR